MAELLKNKNLDINDFKINDYFEFNNVYNFEAIYITDKQLFSDQNGVVIGDIKINNFKNIDKTTSNFVAINHLNQTDVLYIYDLEPINNLNLTEYIQKYSKIIVTNNSNYINELGLFDIKKPITNKKIDKYGIITDL